MKKLLFIVMFLIGVIGFSAGGTYETALKQRMKALEAEVQPELESGVTAEMKNATFKLLEAWDVELNKVYKLIMAKASKNEKEKLLNAQRAWVKKKEKAATAAGNEFKGGTYESLMYAQTELEFTEKRTIELARLYDSMRK
ncbi:MAG: lysozyme inhibitor LprI family protein [Leptotrichiaceae bacterium]|nr:lysozyme inhibitor LprI family protein [Leptotrichiaceae bacterium]